jgi:hypothetical protein
MDGVPMAPEVSFLVDDEHWLDDGHHFQDGLRELYELNLLSIQLAIVLYW